ncbi:MAG: acyl-ACP--UDP-N-acetylglucosamine O-acyltransferase [Bacteroidia bacterium]|nr:acyl-ACP--UDP-N-acetylglucosamine O-acyltransferase [Bacteroidia bacterium]MDW8157306.1 acyl-ACP--UDP-N-acetylglucosamine O-acyltransferase [Bacteroidia bacterium]
MISISPLAFVHPEAQIGKSVIIEPFATVYANVRIGDNCIISPNVVIHEGTIIGNNCKIHTGAVIGSIPQDLKFVGEDSVVEIGDNVIIREFATINRGTAYSQKTIIEENVLIMAYVHIAHDCIIRKNAILSNAVNVAGHVEIGEYAVLGGLCGVHQFSKIGKHAMIAAGTIIRKDVPPYVLAGREPIAFFGVNRRGLKRRGFSNEELELIQNIYRILYLSKLNNTQAIEHINATIEDCEIKRDIVDFILSSQRGIIRCANSIHR